MKKKKSVPRCPLSESLLKKYGSEFTPTTKTDDFDTKVMEILRSPGAACFKGSDISVYTSDKIKVGFFDKDKNRVFLSAEESQYPGDTFEELKKE